MHSEKWKITAHACRVCFGRVLVGEDTKTGKTIARCSECGTFAVGTHTALCCCGIKLRNGQPAGLRCKRNPNISPEVPSEIIVGRADDVPQEPKPRAVEPVKKKPKVDELSEAFEFDGEEDEFVTP